MNVVPRDYTVDPKRWAFRMDPYEQGINMENWNMVWVLGLWGLIFLAGIFLGGWRYELTRKV